MPSNMQILMAAEQRFFKGSSSDDVQRRKLGKKKQWLKKANSILAALWKRAENYPAVRMMYHTIRLSMINAAEDDPELHVYESQIL